MKSIIKNDTFPATLLFFGEEDFLVQEAAQSVYDEAIKQDVTGMNSEVLDGDGMSVDAVLGLARSYPMMGDRRVIWVKHFDKITGAKAKKASDPMADYMSSPTPTTFLLLTASLPTLSGLGALKQKSPDAAKKKIASQKAPFNTLLLSGSWVEYPAMKDKQLLTWLMDRCKERKIEIDAHVADFLVMRSSSSVRELAAEFEKVVTFIGDKDSISEDDILKVVGTERTINVFELQRAFGRADMVAVFTILTKMMSAERQEMLILTMLTRYFVALLKLADARGLSDRAEIAKHAGIPPFAVPDHLSALQKLGLGRVEKGLYEIRRVESLLKSTQSDPLLLLQSMAVNTLQG